MSVRTARRVLAGAAALAAAPAARAQAAASGSGHDLVLGLWPNPLPPPLDGHVGTFLLDVLCWLALATTAKLLFSPVLRTLARSTKTTLDDKAIDILGTPLFIVLLLIGVRVSLRAFALAQLANHALDLVGSLVTITVVGYVVYRSWNEIALVYAHRLSERTRSNFDNRVLPVFEKLGGVIIVLFAGIAMLQAVGVGISWLLAGGAFASLVVGLAAQDTLSNFFSGIHLLLDQPFREGDEIQLENGTVCTVRKVGLRSSHLYNGQTHDMLILPNNLLATKPVTNLMRPDRKHRLWLEVGVAYRSDPDQVKRVLTEAALAHPLVLRTPGQEPIVRLMDFRDSALQFALIFWVADHTQRNPVLSDLRIATLRRCKEAGIELPFPHRVIVPASPETKPPAPGQQELKV